MAEKEPLRKKKAGKQKLMIVLISIISIVGLQLSSLLLLVGMLPAMVCYISDRDPKLHLFKTVALTNFAGCYYHVMDVIMVHNNGISGLHTKLQDPTVWFAMYASASLGYIIFYTTPHIAAAFMQMTSQGRLLHLKMTQERLIKDWGDEVAMQPFEER